MAFTALLLAGQSATPTPAGDPATQSVVVVGRRPDHAKAVRRMTARVAAVGDYSKPLARFASPVCAVVDGLGTLNERFLARLHGDAEAAGIGIAKPGCSPNITVLFVPNGQAVVQALRQRHAVMFGAMEPGDIKRLAADGSPVHLWSFTELRSRDDDRLRQGTTAASSPAPELRVRSASILQSATKVVVVGTIVLIDQHAAVGKTVNQLADYTVMRTLAQARAIGNDATEPTILRLFDEGAAPSKGLTPFDAAYLKAYYKGQPTMLPTGKVSTMAQMISKSLMDTVAATDKPPASK